jgi:hypothetical protein
MSATGLSTAKIVININKNKNHSSSKNKTSHPCRILLVEYHSKGKLCFCRWQGKGTWQVLWPLGGPRGRGSPALGCWRQRLASWIPLEPCTFSQLPRITLGWWLQGVRFEEVMVCRSLFPNYIYLPNGSVWGMFARGTVLFAKWKLSSCRKGHL